MDGPCPFGCRSMDANAVFVKIFKIFEVSVNVAMTETSKTSNKCYVYKICASHDLVPGWTLN